MIIKQISVFLENKSGELARVTGLLSENGINLRALDIAQTSDYGIIRFVSDQQTRAAEILSENDYVLHVSEVFAVKVPDRPGGLSGLLNILSENGINVEYMYSSFSISDRDVVMILRISDREKFERVIGDNGDYSITNL